MRRRRRKLVGLAAAALVAAAAFPSPGSAHAEIAPTTSRPGEQQLYTLTVPTERDVPTVRVEVKVPAGIGSILVEDTPGWKTQLVRRGDKVDAIRFTGGSIRPSFFGTFRFRARNPVEEGVLVWPVRQIYAGGEVVLWGGTPESETPAARTRITESASASAAVEPADKGGRDTLTLAISVAALLAGLAALGVALRR